MAVLDGVSPRTSFGGSWSSVQPCRWKPTCVCGGSQVFEEVSGLVTSILDGYNVCIMAYGQTGSGKTYTIEGPAEDPGVNSRALAELFRSADERSTGFNHAFSASVLEIYNEQIFDLLAGSRDSGELMYTAGSSCSKTGKQHATYATSSQDTHLLRNSSRCAQIPLIAREVSQDTGGQALDG